MKTGDRKTGYRRCFLFGAALLMAGLAPAAALAEEGPAMSVLNPNAHAPVGFIAPTFDGDWRFRIALNGWVPNVVQLDANSDLGGGSREEDLGWLLTNLDYYVPFDFEVRKGSFGVFFHTLFFGLGGHRAVLGPIDLSWNDSGYLFDAGLSYELGRWRLAGGEGAPEITLEPYAEARILSEVADLSFVPFFGGPVCAKQEFDFSNTVPVIGLRTFIDLTEHWNLQFQGDYGGFGVDDNHQTWQALGLIGYRWPGWGVHWNLQAGYRAMRLLDLRRVLDVVEDVRGANVVLGVEF